MLGKSYSLRKKKGFEETLKSGKKVADGYLTTFFLEKKEKKIGIIVSKKVAKKAVIRNRIKRRIREIYRLNREALPEGWIVVIARRATAEANFSSLKRSFLSLSGRI